MQKVQKALLRFGMYVFPGHVRTNVPTFVELVRASGFRAFATFSGLGFPADRELDGALVDAGMRQGVCCRGYSLIHRQHVKLKAGEEASPHG